MTDFLDRLNQGLDSCELHATRVLLAVSGGPDSVALLRGMCAARVPKRLTVVPAHMNHNLRPHACTADVDWLNALCDKLNLPLVVGSRDIPSIARDSGAGIEETARRLRYEFLEQAAIEENCTHIALAHNADDQAETILHHVIRGTGLTGLRGMPNLRSLESGITIVRPLIHVDRRTIVAYLRDIGQDARCDESNADERFTRNRIRHSLLPLLTREFNPRVQEALLRLGRQAGELQETFQVVALQLLKRVTEDRTAALCRINCRELSSAPRHLIRECFLQLWKQMNWPRKKMGFDEWDRLAELVVNGKRLMLPGNIEAVRRGNLMMVERTSRLTPAARPNPQSPIPNP